MPVRSVIYVIVNVIVNAEVSYDLVSRRQNLNPEAEVVRVMVIVEMARTVIVHEISVTRRDSVDIMVFNPEIHGVVHLGTASVVVRLAHVSGNGGAQELDEDEFINVIPYEVSELERLIYAGEITDSKTVAAIMAYKNKYVK